jgi:hypothetical protein
LGPDSVNRDVLRPGGSTARGSTARGIDGARRSPSGRLPQWAVDEALGKLEEPARWRAASPSQAPRTDYAFRGKRPARLRTWRSGSATVLGIALLVGLYFTPSLFEQFVMPAVLPYLPGAKVPPPGFEAAASPLGLPPAATGSTAYVLQKSPDPSQPFVAYDPCRPVHYVDRPDNAPPGTDLLIQEAVARVSASGLHFVYRATSEPSTMQRDAT